MSLHLMSSTADSRITRATKHAEFRQAWAKTGKKLNMGKAREQAHALSKNPVATHPAHRIA